jgi:hypothetical protein
MIPHREFRHDFYENRVAGSFAENTDRAAPKGPFLDTGIRMLMDSA